MPELKSANWFVENGCELTRPNIGLFFLVYSESNGKPCNGCNCKDTCQAWPAEPSGRRHSIRDRVATNADRFSILSRCSAAAANAIAEKRSKEEHVSDILAEAKEFYRPRVRAGVEWLGPERMAQLKASVAEEPLDAESMARPMHNAFGCGCVLARTFGDFFAVLDRERIDPAKFGFDFYPYDQLPLWHGAQGLHNWRYGVLAELWNEALEAHE